MEQFFSKIDEFFKKTKNPFLQMASGVTSLFNERHGDWSFSFTLKSTFTNEYKVAILPGCIPTERIVQVFNDGLGNKVYNAIGGGAVNAIYNNVGDIILLHDEVSFLKDYSGINIDAVVNQEQFQSITGKVQTIFKRDSDDIGAITVQSQNGVDVLRNMIRQNAIRVYEIQIQSSNSDMFSTYMVIKDTNPLKNSSVEYFNLEDWFKTDNALAKKIIVDKPFFLDNLSLLVFSIPGNTEVTITLKASVMFRPAKGIESLTDVQDLMRDIKEYKK